MADSLDDFLAGWVLQDAKLITFRLLSRARNIHVQQAKQALHDFYERTQAKRAGALSALYVLKGTLKTDGDGVPAIPRPTPGAGTDADGDATMTQEAGPSQSNSQAPDAQEIIPRRQLLLVPAHQLEEAKARFASLTTAHIYSLAPGPNAQGPKKDSSVDTTSQLNAARKQIPLLSSVQNDLHSNKSYVLAWEKAKRGKALGVIWNPDVVEDFSPTFGAADNASAAGPSTKKVDKKPLAKPVDKQIKSEDKKPSTSTSIKNEANKTRTAKEKSALENELFPETDKAKPQPVDPDALKSGGRADAPTRRTPSGAQKRSASTEEKDEAADGPSKAGDSGAGRRTSSGEAETPSDAPVKAKKRVTKTRKVTKKERFKNEKGYTVHREVEVEEEYTTDEASDDGRPKPTKMAKKAAASEPKAPSASPSSSPDAQAVKETPAKAPPPVQNKFKGGSGSSGSKAGTNKPADKRQQTLGSFFKKK